MDDNKMETNDGKTINYIPFSKKHFTECWFSHFIGFSLKLLEFSRRMQQGHFQQGKEVSWRSFLFS